VVRAPLQFVEEPLRGYPLKLAGAHQEWNAALAVAALHRAGLRLSYDAVRHGLATVEWPGRFEIFPPERVAGARAPVVLDGAHNPDAALVLAATWRECFGEAQMSLVFSVVEGKDAAATLAPLAPLAARVFLCPVDTPRAVSVEQLARELPAEVPPHACHASAADALQAAMADGLPVLVAGSLFLVGEIRAILAGGEFQGCSQ